MSFFIGFASGMLYYAQMHFEVGTMWRLLCRRWPALLLLPFANVLLVIVFWQSQIAHYQHATQGVLLMWLVAGLVFVLIQLSLQLGAWRHARANDSLGQNHRYETLWILGTQIGTFALAAIYNCIALAELAVVGVRPTQVFDGIIAAIVLVTLALALKKYGRRRIATPQSRLLLATGTKAAPQWMQAGWFAVSGAGGMHAVTMGAICAMGTLRYMLTRIARKQFRDDNTVSANSAALRDLLSIIAMGIGWCIGRLAGWA